MNRTKKILELAKNTNLITEVPVEIEGVNIVENSQSNVVVLGKYRYIHS